MTLTGLVNLVTVLGILCAILAICLIVAVMLLCEQVGARRSAERRVTALGQRLAVARERIHGLLTRPAPVRPTPDATQELPRAPHAPTYKPGGAVMPAPGTALVPRDAQLPVPVRQR